MPPSAARSTICSRMRSAAAGSRSPTPSARRQARATSCWQWARWARASSTIRATSTSSCSTTPLRRASAGTEPAPFYVRITRALVKLLQERTADGYVFRTDLRLRPDPASTQIAISTASALDYYESRGQNWERAALIKARACAGDLAAGEALLGELSPFIWRKYLDFAAVADVHAMKRQIHAYRGHDQIAVEGHNIKLGRGGIREIEFFVQTQQLIAGGRHPELRTKETLRDARRAGRWGLDRRATCATISAPPIAFCARSKTACKWSPTSRPTPCHAIGRRSNASPVSRALRIAMPSRTRWSPICATCSAITRRCSRMRPASRRAIAFCCFPPEADDRETLDRLTEMGFRQPLEVSALVRRWSTGTLRVAERRVRARPARRDRAAAAPSVRALGESRRGRASLSTASSPGFTAAAGCFRCCGRIPISSR